MWRAGAPINCAVALTVYPLGTTVLRKVPDRRGLRETRREVFPVPGGGSARVELPKADRALGPPVGDLPRVLSHGLRP